MADSAHIPTGVLRFIESVASILGHDCIVLQVNNSLLSSKEKSFLDGKLSKSGNAVKIEFGDSMKFLNSLLDALLIQKIQHNYCDFEDHANNSGDFRNPIASNFITHYTPVA